MSSPPIVGRAAVASALGVLVAIAGCSSTSTSRSCPTCATEKPADAGTSDASLAAGAGRPTSDAAVPATDAAIDAAPARPPPRVLISEIMYHPVLEEAFEEAHEFIELYNAEGEAVSLAGWSVGGGDIAFSFDAATTIPAHGYLAVAKDRAALLSVYAAAPERVAGDFSGELANGEGGVSLIRPDLTVADAVAYSDKFPWPYAADALGASEDFLPQSLVPLAAHQYRGRSLERVSADAPTRAVYNWDVSALDGATPGAANGSERAAPLPIVESLTFSAVKAGVAAPGAPIEAADEVRIEVACSDVGEVAAVTVEYFVDDVAVEGEPVTRVPLQDGGGRRYAATLPPQPARSIVRVRVLSDRGGGEEVLSPRPSDPFAFHAYYVTPARATGSRVYDLYISPGNWTQLWNNASGGRVSGCTPAAAWDAKVPAVFVFDGRVVDARVRYQGSRWNRLVGNDLASWPYPGPSSQLKALSWHVTLPRYGELEGRDAVLLNKMTQTCPGLSSQVGFALFRAVGIPSPHTRYVRLEINGGYYHYMQEIEHPDAQMIDAQRAQVAAAVPLWGDEPIGHLFKAQGCNCDEGPYGWADGRILPAACGHDAATRYAYTYDRATWKWAGHSALQELIEGLAAARATNDTATVRDFLAARFDVDLVLSYLAIINWSVPFDDMFQNHFLYQRRSDGKWCFLPWDLDQTFGRWKGASASLFMGEEGDPDNRNGWWNHFKDAFLDAYRAELVARMKMLGGTVLAPANIDALVDATMAEADYAEAQLAPSGTDCDFPAEATAFKAFAAQRHAVVQSAPSP